MRVAGDIENDTDRRDPVLTLLSLSPESSSQGRGEGRAGRGQGRTVRVQSFRRLGGSPPAREADLCCT